jgi:hypothetical protein
MASSGRSRLWRLFGTISAILAGMAARKALEAVWKGATGNTPPTNPESPDTTVREAIGWAVASGAAIGVARMFATRKAADYWRKSTGALPPGLEEVS